MLYRKLMTFSLELLFLFVFKEYICTHFSFVISFFTISYFREQQK